MMHVVFYSLLVSLLAVAFFSARRSSTKLEVTMQALRSIRDGALHPDVVAEHAIEQVSNGVVE